MKITGKTILGIFCSECRSHTTKTVKNLRAHIRHKRSGLYCSRSCANKAHSKRMSGVNNPNYEGKFHGMTMADRTVEERRVIGRKISETMLKRKTSEGENNGRWSGGQREHDCVICGISTRFSPYIHRKIEAGEQSPCCSIECAAALGRRNLKQESTSIEIAMADELKRRGIEYIEQYNLGDKFRLDFLLPEYGIVIECDGDYWHNLPEVKTRDKSKNAYIKACGYSLYRFWEHEINTDVSACVDIVLAEINESEAIA